MQQWEGTAKIGSPSATPPLHTAATEIDIYKSNISFVVRKFAFRFFQKKSSMQLSVRMYGLALNVTIKENVYVSF